MVDLNAQRPDEDDWEWTKRDVKRNVRELKDSVEVAKTQAIVKGKELASVARVEASRKLEEAKRKWRESPRPNLRVRKGLQRYAVSQQKRVPFFAVREPSNSYSKQQIGSSARVINPRRERVGPQSESDYNDNLPQHFGPAVDWRATTSARLFDNFGLGSPIEATRGGLPRFWDKKSSVKRRGVFDERLPKFFG